MNNNTERKNNTIKKSTISSNNMYDFSKNCRKVILRNLFFFKY